MSLRSLNDWEVSLIKAFCEQTSLNDQQILAYFTRPQRTVNHRVISGIRTGRYFAGLAVSTEEELAYFKDRWHKISISKGKIREIEELVAKSREAMVSAIQSYNNPRVSFRSEIFIVLSIIAWTYLLHAYYRRQNISYAYQRESNGKIEIERTTAGQPKLWDLSKSLSVPQCPLADAMKANLDFVLNLRHEIEHRSTGNIDQKIAAKLQATALNFNTALVDLFGSESRIDTEFGVAIQMASFGQDQAKLLYGNAEITPTIESVIDNYDQQVPDDIFNDARYAFRIIFVEQACNREGQADQVVTFVRAGTEAADSINRVLLKEREKPKYKPGSIVKEMRRAGFHRFSLHHHTELWKRYDAKNPKNGYGVLLSDSQWYFYDNWLDVVKRELEAAGDQFKKRTQAER
ncbi:MAG: hypothetical protein QOD89_1310 [Bradyrhizobium sp.]|jgi:hypothetical protein|nr:hypothetical protein [Bradyrhizobium sp.]